MVSLTCHPILSVWYHQIRRILSEYSLGVGHSQPDIPSNIICVVMSDQADTVWIFTQHRQWLAWHAIQYYLCVTVRSGGYCLNIYSAWATVSLTCQWILSVWYRRIRQILSEYSLSIGHSQPDMSVNIICVYHWIRWILSKYLLGVGNSQPDMPSNIICVLPSD